MIKLVCPYGCPVSAELMIAYKGNDHFKLAYDIVHAERDRAFIPASGVTQDDADKAVYLEAKAWLDNRYHPASLIPLKREA